MAYSKASLENLTHFHFTRSPLSLFAMATKFVQSWLLAFFTSPQFFSPLPKFFKNMPHRSLKNPLSTQLEAIIILFYQPLARFLFLIWCANKIGKWYSKALAYNVCGTSHLFRSVHLFKHSKTNVRFQVFETNSSKHWKTYMYLKSYQSKPFTR